MQPNLIALSVDTENDDVGLETQNYNRFDEYQNRSIYTEDNHSLDARNTMTLYRTAPKAAGNFKGVAKTSFKFSEDFTVDGVDGVSQLTAPIIAECKFSIPVGCTTAQILEIRQRVLALLDRDDIMGPLNEQQMI